MIHICIFVSKTQQKLLLLDFEDATFAEALTLPNTDRESRLHRCREAFFQSSVVTC